MENQIDCFKIHLTFFKYLGIWARTEDQFPYYNYYSKIFIAIFYVFYVFLLTLNFYFMELQLDKIIEQMIVYLDVISDTSKLFTFIILRDNIGKILSILESEDFQPNTERGSDIVLKTKNTNIFFWKLFAAPSLTCFIFHSLLPFVLHIALGKDLYLTVCTYEFLSNDLKETLIYPLYFYQVIGLHIYMWLNVNLGTFFLGLMNLTIAQLDILDDKLRNLTQNEKTEYECEILNSDETEENIELKSYLKLRQCAIHYAKIVEFCSLIEDTFDVSLFIQFSVAAYVICVCLFRLHLPISPSYVAFLSVYILVMTVQILLLCWFGQQITDKSSQLAVAVYNCDWPPRQRTFKSTLRLLAERAGRPLCINGWKIIPLSLRTFTSIANSAYSFYTLLRNVQTGQRLN